MTPLLKLLQPIGLIWRKRFFLVALFTVAVILGSAVGVLYFERGQGDSNILNFWDGVWWAVVTMGTVGYGDKYPVSTGGRVVGFFLIFFGVGLMSLFTATIASAFVEKKIKEEKGLEGIKEKGHIVICGWNEHTEEVLQALINYGTVADTSVVLINELSVDEMDTLKLKYGRQGFRFLRGNYVHEDVLLRANITKAHFALIMADTTGSHTQDRADERTTLAILAIKSLAPSVKTVAELLNGENRPHLRRAGVDEIIVRGEHVGALLASAVSNPGIPRLFSQILSPTESHKLWRTSIPKQFIGGTFRDLFHYFREKHQALLVAILQEKKTVKLEDLLSDSTSALDAFIKEKIREAKEDLLKGKSEMRIIVNPEDNYVIEGNDVALVIARKAP